MSLSIQLFSDGVLLLVCSWDAMMKITGVPFLTQFVKLPASLADPHPCCRMLPLCLIVLSICLTYLLLFSCVLFQLIPLINPLTKTPLNIHLFLGFSNLCCSFNVIAPQAPKFSRHSCLLEDIKLRSSQNPLGTTRPLKKILAKLTHSTRESSDVRLAALV